jgi:uncharacterized protein (TIGR02246 family)
MKISINPLIASLTLILISALSPLAWAADLQSDLMANVKSAWAAWGKKDIETYRKYLTEDAVEIVVDSKPVRGRDAIIKNIQGQSCKLNNIAFEDVKMRRLGEDAAVLSYTVKLDASCDGKPLPPKLAATNIFEQQNGKWLSTSYQETPIP